LSFVIGNPCSSKGQASPINPTSAAFKLQC